MTFFLSGKYDITQSDRLRNNPSHLFLGTVALRTFSPLATAPFLQDRQNSIRIAVSEYFELEGYHTIWYNSNNQTDILWRIFIFPNSIPQGTPHFWLIWISI